MVIFGRRMTVVYVSVRLVLHTVTLSTVHTVQMAQTWLYYLENAVDDVRQVSKITFTSQLETLLVLCLYL